MAIKLTGLIRWAIYPNGDKVLEQEWQEIETGKTFWREVQTVIL